MRSAKFCCTLYSPCTKNIFFTSFGSWQDKNHVINRSWFKAKIFVPFLINVCCRLRFAHRGIDAHVVFFFKLMCNVFS